MKQVFKELFQDVKLNWASFALLGLLLGGVIYIIYRFFYEAANSGL